jgi:hypothetical protein
VALEGPPFAPPRQASVLSAALLFRRLERIHGAAGPEPRTGCDRGW